MKRISRLMGTIAILALAGCILIVGEEHGERFLEGSGIVRSQERVVGEFRRIEARLPVEIVVRVGEPARLLVSGDENLLGYVKTEVREGTLVVEMGPPGKGYGFHRGLELEIWTPELEGLAISTSAEARVSGLRGPLFAVEVGGSAEVQAAGEVERLEVRVSGSGDLDLFALAAREARVEISGSGRVRVSASERIEGAISGSGEILYRGEPEIDVRVSGSGTVSRR